MSDPIYEKAPKGPNFLLIVILSGVVILVIMAAVLLFMHHDSKLVPHGPNPEPNSRLLMPGVQQLAAPNRAAC